MVLAAARLDMDQTEARLLNAAHASAMGSEQIAAILDLSVEHAEERHRQLKPAWTNQSPKSPRPAKQPSHPATEPSDDR